MFSVQVESFDVIFISRAEDMKRKALMIRIPKDAGNEATFFIRFLSVSKGF